MSKFRTTYVGEAKMFNRIDTCHFYPCNDTTSNAVCQLEWAYEALGRENVKFQNGKELHEIANETVEKHEDELIDFLCVTAGG